MEAFRVMERATSETLKGFNFDARKDKVRMGVVSGAQNVTWDENF